MGKALPGLTGLAHVRMCACMVDAYVFPRSCDLTLLNLANDYARLHQISQKSDQELKIQLEGAPKDFKRLEERVRTQDVS